MQLVSECLMNPYTVCVVVWLLLLLTLQIAHCDGENDPSMRADFSCQDLNLVSLACLTRRKSERR